jgi:uncharacterized protein YkwD
MGQRLELWAAIAASLVAAQSSCVAHAAEPRPTGPLGYEAAQSYVLSLINRDRKAAGLPAVVLDQPGSDAAQRHARDMATHGFTGHIGTDGSVPEQRYSESGGVHFSQENAACLFDAKPRKLESAPRFDPAKLAALQKMFMDEKPPADGHRRNILTRSHNRVGIGLAQALDTNQPCLVQEFVDARGEYDALPRQARPRAKLQVVGSVSAPLTFGGIGISHAPTPKPLTVEQVGGAKSYAIPAPETLYFPEGFKTPKPVKLDKNRFSLELELPAKPGRYSVSIWAKQKGSSKLFMVSLRTLSVP